MNSNPSSELTDFLQKTDLLSSVPRATLSKLAEHLVSIQLAAGEVLIREGEPGDTLYLVQHGQLKVITYDQDGNEVLFNYKDAGEVIGEVSLLTGERRTATVVVVSDCKLVSLARTQFQHFEQEHPDEMALVIEGIVRRLQQAHLTSSLLGTRLLSSLDKAALQDLIAELELQLLPSGTTLIQEGENSDALYIVVNGLLHAVSKQRSGELNYYEIGRGQTVGEIGLITGSMRNATVITVRDSLVARLSLEAFNRLMEKHPQAIMRQFAGKVIEYLLDTLRGKPRNKAAVNTIALIPLHPDFQQEAFAAQLTQALSALGSLITLDSTKLEEALMKKGVAQTPLDDPANFSIVRWLGDQESKYQYVLYVADPTLSPWTQRCLRQADRILLAANADASPEIGEMEAQINAFLADQVRSQNILVLQHPQETNLPKNTRRWLQNRALVGHYHIRAQTPKDYGRLARLITGQGIGFALSGGGARGVAHLGALKALTEVGVPVDMVAGVSAGGIMSCLWATGWSFSTIMEALIEAAGQNLKDYTFPYLSFMAGAKMTDNSKKIFGPDTYLEDLWLPCALTSANISSFRLMVHNQGPVWKYIRATSSLPAVFPPVMENGEMLIDGALLNNLPADIVYQRPDIATVFALDVGQSTVKAAQQSPYETSFSGWQVLKQKLTAPGTPMDIPNLGEVLMRMTNISNEQSLKTNQNLTDFFMYLDPGPIGLLDFDAFEVAAENGYRSALKIIESWQDNPKFQALVQ